jgi:hypothetical protein
MLMSGELDPDATGTYEHNGYYAGEVVWSSDDEAWSIWKATTSGKWILSATPGIEPLFQVEAGWMGSMTINPQGPFYAVPPATGTATVTEVP